MVTDLNKYKHSGTFVYKPDDNLAQVCNAPADKAGVYLIYGLKNGTKTLKYIGRSGKKETSGVLFIRKGGIKDRLINGKRDGELRRKFWLSEMLKEQLEALEINWFATHNDEYVDCPAFIENVLIRKYRPSWNR